MSVRPSLGVHLVPVAVAPLLLVGIGVGAEAGWLVNLGALVAVGALVHRMQPGLEHSREHGLPGLGLLPGLTITAMGLLVAIVLAAATAVAVGDVLVAYPAAIWALPVLTLAALLRGRWRALGLWGLALAVPLAGWMGDGFESEGEYADGWAHSGPIAGVHPFQATAVLIDGHGPFDLPINDYVEPDGSRGYGPLDLAIFVERNLHALADIHFANGPARARKAFGEATVETGEIPQLYDEQINPLSIGLQVSSGTHGDGSRVEFVCPGQVLDPRSRRPDTVMRDTCPDKYAAEASAGLGLTGRWAGYTEARGNARLSLARLGRATRSEDAHGRRVVETERTLWGAALLVIGVVFARRRQSAINVAGLAGATACVALVLGFAAMVALVEAPTVPAIGSVAAMGWGFGSVLAAATGLAGLVWLGGTERDDGSIWGASVMGLLALGSAWTLASPRASFALARVRSPGDLAGVLADAASMRTGLDVQALEGAVAAALVVMLVGAALLFVGPLARASVRLGLDVDTQPRWPTLMVGLGAILLVAVAPPDRVVLLLGVGLGALTASMVSIASRRANGAKTIVDIGMHLVLAASLAWTLANSISSAGWVGSSFVAAGLAAVFVALSLTAALGRATATS